MTALSTMTKRGSATSEPNMRQGQGDDLAVMAAVGAPRGRGSLGHAHNVIVHR